MADSGYRSYSDDAGSRLSGFLVRPEAPGVGMDSRDVTLFRGNQETIARIFGEFGLHALQWRPATGAAVNSSPLCQTDTSPASDKHPRVSVTPRYAGFLRSGSRPRAATQPGEHCRRLARFGAAPDLSAGQGVGAPPDPDLAQGLETAAALRPNAIGEPAPVLDRHP